MNFIFRADANLKIGAGHLIRCLSLAQRLKWRGHEVYFVRSDASPIFQDWPEKSDIHTVWIADEPGSLSDARTTLNLIQKFRCDSIIIDGYQFGTSYQETIFTEKRTSIMVIDDNGEHQRYACDVILNQNIHASSAMYENRPDHTKLLLGTDYILLRSGILNSRRSMQAAPKPVQNILVLSGGSNIGNGSEVLLRCLDGIAEKQRIRLVSGQKMSDQVERTFKRPFRNLEIRSGVDDIESHFSWADIALSTAGSTVWEMAYFGLPAALLEVADNQRAAMNALIQRNCFLGLGSVANLDIQYARSTIKALMEDPTLRKTLSQNCMKLVDGKGSERVQIVLEELLVERNT